MQYYVVSVLPLPRGEQVSSSTEWKGDRHETRIDYSSGDTEYVNQITSEVVSIVIDGDIYFIA